MVPAEGLDPAPMLRGWDFPVLLLHGGADVDVVFVTAYDEYALRAFEVNALDYLLKPVAPERLAVTVHRLAAAQPPAPPRETVTYDGKYYVLPRPGGPGKALKLIIKPVQDRIADHGDRTYGAALAVRPQDQRQLDEAADRSGSA